MKKNNMFVVLSVVFVSFFAQAEQIATHQNAAFNSENVECKFIFQTEKMESDQVISMTKGTLNGMVGTLTGFFATVSQDGISYLVTASSPLKMGEGLIMSAEVTVTNTNEGRYSDGMMKGSILITEQNAIGFVGTTNTAKRGKKFVSSRIGVMCSIPELVQK